VAARIKARRLRKKGWTYAKIGAVLGVSRQRVHQYLSETAKPVGS
jgi:predicted transcriptional regulator